MNVTIPARHQTDSYIEAYLRRGEINDVQAKALRSISDALHQHDVQRGSIAANVELSAEGKARRLSELHAKTFAGFADVETSIKFLDTRIGSTRARALQATQREHTAIDEMRHRELRDVARQQATRTDAHGQPTLDQNRLDAIYHRALTEKNTDLIAALEVSAFGLVSGPALQRGEAMKIDASGLGGELQSLEQARNAYATVLDAAKRQLGSVPAVAA